MTSSAREAARKGPVSSIATQAAEAAHVRTNKRRMSVAAQSAAAAARKKSEEKELTQSRMESQAKRRFSLIAAEAAAAAAPAVSAAAPEPSSKGASSKKSSAEIMFGDETRWSSSSWHSEYDGKYKQPAYLTALAKAAAAAQDAAITLSRQVGNCSEYLASYRSNGDAEIPQKGDSSPAFNDQVGECLDFTQAEET